MEDEIRSDPQPVIDMLARDYALHLSADDLNALAAFYESPVGQRYLSALPAIQTETSQASRQWAEQVLVPRLLNRIESLGHQTPPGHT